MELWYSEFHTGNVKLSVRINRQLFSGESEFQRIDVFESEEFGRFVALDGEIVFSDKDEFIYEPKELTAIVKLTVGDVDEVTIEELRGSEKLNNIIQNIYRGEYIKHLGKMDSVYFKQCIDIAKNIRFFKVTRPANQFTVDTQINLIEREIISAKEIVV